MELPSDHSEKIEITSPDPTVGGVKTLLTLKENVEDREVVIPVTVSLFWLESYEQAKLLVPIPETSVQVGLFVIVVEARGSLDQEPGITITILPPEGIVLVGVRLNVKGADTLTNAELAEIPHAKS